MSGSWSLDARHQNGDTREAGYACCGGCRRPEASGAQGCADGAGACATVDEKCVAAADGCPSAGSALACLGGCCAVSSKD